MAIGMLKAGEKKEITVTFAPQEGKVVIATAVFNFQEGSFQC